MYLLWTKQHQYKISDTAPIANKYIFLELTGMTVIFGTNLDDTLAGGNESDSIFDLAGNNSITGGNGDDF